MGFIHLDEVCAVQTAKRGCNKEEQEEKKKIKPKEETTHAIRGIQSEYSWEVWGRETFHALHPGTRAQVTAVIRPCVPESSSSEQRGISGFSF